MNTNPPRSCKHCSKPLPIIRKARAVYCSDLCSDAAYQARRRKAPQATETRTCQGCPATFEALASSRQIYCTHACGLRKARADAVGFDAALDAKRPTRKTTPQDIEIAYQRAIAAQRGAAE